jgi:AraC family transcriptional regulator, transcriptional activator of pobA
MKDVPIRKIKTSAWEIDVSKSFSIRKVEDVLGGEDMFHALHRHDFFFVLALQKGEGRHEIDFQEYSVEDHSIFLLRPGQVHQLELKADNTGFLMEFDATFHQPGHNLSRQRFRRTANTNFCKPEAAGFEKMLSILSGIFHELTARQEGYLDVIKANLEIFFIEFLRQSQNPAPTENGNTYSQSRLDDFMTLLETRLADLKQVSQYADLLNLSTYQLNSITKTTVGKAASELINEQIILEAKRYLLATTNQVKDIASQLGYEDVSYFIRFFKKHTGHSPEAFRKISR